MSQGHAWLRAARSAATAASASGFLLIDARGSAARLCASAASAERSGASASREDDMPQTFSRDDASLRRLAYDAAIWGTPIVSFDAMRQAFFRDAEAEYG